MSLILMIIEAVAGILLCITVLLQQRASGLSATFGGSGAIAVQRRGAEKVLYQGVIVLACIFFGIALLQLFIA